jgi:hypothetical protein
VSSRLIERAEAWIEPYWNARHLLRTRDWLLELEPAASTALQLAALTHDMERHFPGGPEFDPGTMAPHDEDYRKAHCERSATIVARWLRAEEADDALVREVQRLIAAHETGGDPDADLLQAADSISFLETNADLVLHWYLDGRCSPERAKAQHARMLERIQIPRARALAAPLYDWALALIDREAAARA